MSVIASTADVSTTCGYTAVNYRIIYQNLIQLLLYIYVLRIPHPHTNTTNKIQSIKHPYSLGQEELGTRIDHKDNPAL